LVRAYLPSFLPIRPSRDSITGLNALYVTMWGFTGVDIWIAILRVTTLCCVVYLWRFGYTCCHHIQAVLTREEGEAGTNYRVPAFRKSVMGQNMLHIFFLFLASPLLLGWVIKYFHRRPCIREQKYWCNRFLKNLCNQVSDYMVTTKKVKIGINTSATTGWWYRSSRVYVKANIIFWDNKPLWKQKYRNLQIAGLPFQTVAANRPIISSHFQSPWKPPVYRVSQEECEILRESVPYVKLYRYNPKHLHPKLNGYGDNDQRKVWTSCISAYCMSTAVAH